MSTSGTTAAVYAVAVSLSTTTGAVPDDAKEKRHHVKGGVGFQNPWDSWFERGGFQIAKAMIGYVA
jgi:N-acyl-phosphatidylethanolamine-hydrolysing phospholipase D